MAKWCVYSKNRICELRIEKPCFACNRRMVKLETDDKILLAQESNIDKKNLLSVINSEIEKVNHILRGMDFKEDRELIKQLFMYDSIIKGKKQLEEKTIYDE